MAVEHMDHSRWDALPVMDAARVSRVETTDHLDGNHTLLDQMESIEKQMIQNKALIGVGVVVFFK